MMTEFLNRLQRGPVLFDGAMGSLLLSAGLEPGQAPELWNVNRPEVLSDIHRRYIDAGAEVITTNSFGGTPLKLADYGLADRCVELNFAGARLALAARAEFPARQVFVAGDFGPCGKFFPPVGKLDRKSLADTIQAQVEVFAQAGIDLLLMETMVDLQEAEIAVLAMRKLCDLPVVATMTFGRKPRGFFTIMGNTPRDACARLADAGADMVGANCTLAADEMLELAEELVRYSPVPVLVQPNAGQPEMVEGQVVYRVSPEAFAREMQKILATGVAAIGGCCGTTPEHIRAVAELMHHDVASDPH